ncbi:TldD/PmbA family protein [Candidatus Aminicenantes bacterium AH-873-B07]|jgi:PmbA protein|nr:TldD/PmbA family protein [Candidatus Aminicenantes bacterium AH-873-B07]
MKEDKENLMGLAEDLVNFGRKNGADEIEVSIIQGYEFNVNVRLGEIENLVEASSKKLFIRIIKNKKVALVKSEDFSKETLERLILNTIKRAEFGNPDEFACLPKRQKLKIDISSLNLYDPQISELSTKKKIGLAMETERIALMDKRITNSHGASFNTNKVKRILINSNGFSGQYIETNYSLSIGLQAGETDARVEGYWYCARRHLRELETPEEIAKKAVERTVRQLGAKKIKTQNVPVVLEPNMTSELLAFLFTCVSGISIYQKASFLADKLGEKIGNDLITIIDDGLMPGKLGTRPFDSEGVPTQKTIVIKKGVLESYLCNTYAARKLKLKSTGNCSGKGVGPNNFYLMPDKYSPEEIIKSVDKGLLLIRTIGHGLNPVTGDISRGAFGLWIEKGEIVYPVSEITISGNLSKILNQIEMVGNDLDFRSRCAGPTIKIGEMTISGI